MSICSLLSSRSMTAVLRTSLTSCRSSVNPGVIVLTFQVPNFRAGDFLVFLPGARFPIRLSAFLLNLTHPVRLADRGEVAPSWLGAAQLEAGGSHLLRYGDLSHRRKQPLASSSTPIKLRLRTGRLLLPVLCQRCIAVLECPLQGAKPGWVNMEEKLLPMQQVPPLHVAGKTQRKGKANTLGFQRHRRSCQVNSIYESDLP